MRLPLILTIFAFCSIFTSCAKAQDLTTAQETPTVQKTKTTALTEAQAIEFAEKYIERNGYTDLPADKETLDRESIEWDANVDEMLKSRQNTLERKAYGVSNGRKGNIAGWTIVFRYESSSDKETRKNGRAVTMNLDGSNARVEHVDFILAKVEKRL